MNITSAYGPHTGPLEPPDDTPVTVADIALERDFGEGTILAILQVYASSLAGGADHLWYATIWADDLPASYALVTHHAAALQAMDGYFTVLLQALPGRHRYTIQLTVSIGAPNVRFDIDSVSLTLIELPDWDRTPYVP